MRALAKVVLGGAAAVAVTTPADALPTKAKNACALLTTSEIEQEFGPDVAKATKGPGPKDAYSSPSTVWVLKAEKRASAS